MKKFVFLVYSARSGSTLLAAMLNQLRGVHVIPETSFLPRLVVNRLAEKQLDNSDVLEFIKQEPQFPELGIDDHILLESVGSSAENILEKKWLASIIDSYYPDIPEGDIVVLKCGGALLCMPELASLFPQALFLHVVRDARAVCASKKNTTSTWNRKINKSVIGSASNWNKRMQLAEAFNGNCLEVRYEDTIKDKATEIDKIADFLGLDERQREVSQSVEDYVRRIGGNQKHLHGNVGDPNTDHIHKWKQALDDYEVAYIESKCARHLALHGYEVDLKRLNCTVRRNRYRLWKLKAFLSYGVEKVVNFSNKLFESQLTETINKRLYSK